MRGQNGKPAHLTMSVYVNAISIKAKKRHDVLPNYTILRSGLLQFSVTDNVSTSPWLNALRSMHVLVRLSSFLFFLHYRLLDMTSCLMSMTQVVHSETAYWGT